MKDLIVPGSTPTWTLTNADGKQWVLPAADLATALCLYQPGGIKGKILKAAFPVLSHIPGMCGMIGAVAGSHDLSRDVMDLCREAFGSESLRWALFGGTPSPHSKPTIQLWDESGILGYCKLTDSESLYRSLFVHERDLLGRLDAAGVGGIPQVKACREISPGRYAFVQSTVKTRRSAAVHSWTPLHDDFINALQHATRENMSWEETDTYRSLRRLYENLDAWLPVAHRAVAGRHLGDIFHRLEGSTIAAVASHGDFTPWNMIVEAGRLFVFDWEYAAMHSYPGLDKWHFLIQSAIFERRMTVAQIFAMISSLHDPDHMSLRIYLLDILSRFASREPDIWQTGVNPTGDIWVGMLERMA